MSAPLLESYVAHLDPLQSEDTIRTANAIALGTGSLKRDERAKLVGALESGRREPTRPVRTAAQLHEMAAELGLTIEKGPLDA